MRQEDIALHCVTMRVVVRGKEVVRARVFEGIAVIFAIPSAVSAVVATVILVIYRERDKNLFNQKLCDAYDFSEYSWGEPYS